VFHVELLNCFSDRMAFSSDFDPENWSYEGFEGDEGGIGEGGEFGEQETWTAIELIKTIQFMNRIWKYQEKVSIQDESGVCDDWEEVKREPLPEGRDPDLSPSQEYIINEETAVAEIVDGTENSNVLTEI